MKKILFIFIISLLILSCKKETETVTSDLGYNYFPMEKGSYIIYKGDSILYNYFYTDVKRTRSFYLKEIVTDTSRDNLNRLAYEMDVYERFSTTEPWTHKVKWYKITANRTAERVEDNLRYIKLVFPANIGTSWNPYKYISMKMPYIYEIDSSLDVQSTTTLITEKDILYNNSYLSFDSTLTTVSIIDSSGVDYYKITERYTKNIGLVYREQWNVIAKDPGRNPSLPWIDRARLGFYFKIEAIEYGKE